MDKPKSKQVKTPKRIKINELLPDRANANQGTERGQYMVDKSIEKLGAGRSILIDRDNEVIAGNKTLQALADAGYTELLVVETDGKQAVAVKRTDMDLDDASTGARELAYSDNRASELGLAWDAAQLLADVNEGIDLDALFLDWEIDKIVGSLADAQDFDVNAEWVGMPEFEQEEQPYFKSLKLNFNTEQDMLDFAELIGQNITSETKFINYPKAENIPEQSNIVVADE